MSAEWRHRGGLAVLVVHGGPADALQRLRQRIVGLHDVGVGRSTRPYAVVPVVPGGVHLVAGDHEALLALGVLQHLTVDDRSVVLIDERL